MPMMQHYDLLSSTNTPSDTTNTTVQPSPRVVQNILQYARCQQDIKLGDISIKVYLN